MMDENERLKKRLALSVARQEAQGVQGDVTRPAGALISSATAVGLAPDFLAGLPEGEELKAEAAVLMMEVRAGVDDEKLTDLLEACQRECLQAIIRPLGLARVLFDDKLGGNVATIHNVRSEEYQASDNTAWKASGDQAVYQAEIKDYADSKEAYKDYKKSKGATDLDDSDIRSVESVQDPKYKYRSGNSTYKKTKDTFSEAQNAGTLIDPLRGVAFDPDDTVHVDHAVSCEQVAKDPGRILAGLSGPELVNIRENLLPLLGHVNQSKGDRTVEGTLNLWRRQKVDREKEIKKLTNLAAEGQASDEQQGRLKRLKQLDSISEDALREAVGKGEKAINAKVSRTYYTSDKFVQGVLVSGAHEGARMGTEQAFGLLMEEFTRAAFAEVRDIWRNGFHEQVDDTFLSTLKTRLGRIARRVQGRWKHALHAFRDGIISGFLSNLITVAINMFATTSVRVVRVIREGFMSLFRALKTLVFPEEGMSRAQAADAALKLFAAGVITSGGIMLEQSIESSLAFLGPLAPYLSAMGAGLVTGLCTAFAIHFLDRLDLFGVREGQLSARIAARLHEMVSLSYLGGIDAARAFGTPELPYLKEG